MHAKLIIDFGLVILIWMTQLVVYPSFTYYAESDLIQWHQRYTVAVSIIVMPLMLGQVLVHGVDLYQSISLVSILTITFIACAWINTFFFAVPLHNKISVGEEVLQNATRLVQINWYRTGLWSAVFLIDLFSYVKNP